uniref:Uncharacterized protein n=1 Tax=viral metagenome TaxID=1070528 RepID=A0A6C0DTW1_9ZZZZ
MEGHTAAYNISILVIMRWFVLWGIFECLVFIVTKGDKTKELILHSAVFVLLTAAAYLSPSLMAKLSH